MKRVALLLVAASLVASSCSDDDEAGESSSAPGGITVFADTSLAAVFQELAPDTTFDFASSDELQARIEEGEQADVYAVAGSDYWLKPAQDALIETPEIFAVNRLVLVVPADNPEGIESLDDLGADVALAVGAEGSSLGDYTRVVLDAAGKAEVLSTIAFAGQDGQAVLASIESGEADAGFVYATDAQAAGDAVETIELPAQALLQYAIAVVATTEDPEAGEAFVELVLGEEGQQKLELAGFGVPAETP